MRYRGLGLLCATAVLALHCGSSAGNGSDAGGGGDATSSSGSGSSGAGSGSSSGSSGGSGGSGASSGSGSGGGSGSSSGGVDGGSSSGSGSSSGGVAIDAGGVGNASVLMMHNHINRDGFFVDGAFKTATLKTTGMMHLDATFAPTGIVGRIWASPLYVENGVGGKGTFYLVTQSNNVYAIDETTGNQAISTKNVSKAVTDGIIGTPAIDLATRLMVFDAGTNPSPTPCPNPDPTHLLINEPCYTHTIHAWSIDTFAEAWSLDVSTLSDPVVGKFLPRDQSQRSAVLIVGGIAYVTYGGHWGDAGQYNGWVVGVPLSGPAGAKAYATPNKQCGMWAAGGPASDGTNVFVSTGNGPHNAQWGGEFAVMRFQPGPVFSNTATDYWYNQYDLSAAAGGDKDLSGSNPMIVDAPAGMTPPKLVVQYGKDHNVYLLDPSNLMGGASPLSQAAIVTDLPVTQPPARRSNDQGEMANVPAWAKTPSGTYIAGITNDQGIGAGCPTPAQGHILIISKVDPAAANKMTVVACVDAKGGGSPSITTSDGSNDALIWTFGTDTKGGATGGDNQLHAWDLATGAPVVTGSDVAPTPTHHFTTPIFVHGRAMIVGDNALYAYKP